MIHLGQILPHSEFGQWLTRLARQAEVIVEVGTWHGEGSTRCIANGLARPSQRFWTVEQDTNVCERARSRYNDLRITFVNAHCLDVIDKLPATIDLLLLDGHDEQTDAEFDALWERCKWIALDDTCTRKNKRQVEILIQKQWKRIAGCDTERHGWAIFQRP